MSHRQRNIAIAVAAAALVLGALLGAVAGIWFAAPNVTDLRNACVADQVVPSAGLRPGTTVGPRTAPPIVTPVQGN
ncbi:MAG: hypothetical protein JOY78_03085 [Pseudonocardia sp.]|nr:hypothetical protein [Pseudonocardia sp.]